MIVPRFRIILCMITNLSGSAELGTQVPREAIREDAL
jgi:hypothetical protein